MLVSFSFRRYKDEVLCDVVPMHARHLLLGRSWQYDRRTIHDGFKNIYSFVKEGRTFILVLLTPSQVYEDQVRLRESEQKKRGEAETRKERDTKSVQKKSGTTMKNRDN